MHLSLYFLSSSKLWAGKAWWLQGIYMNWHQGGTRMCHTWEKPASTIYSLICVLLEQSITDRFVFRIWKKQTPEVVWISLLCVVLRRWIKTQLENNFSFPPGFTDFLTTLWLLTICTCVSALSQKRQSRCATNPSINTGIMYGKSNFGLQLTKNSPKKPPNCCLCFMTKCVCRHSLWDVSKPPGRIPRAAVHLCTDCGSGATGK